MTVEPCRLGYEEYDGSRYCFAHGGFVEPGTGTLICDRKPSLLPEWERDLLDALGVDHESEEFQAELRAARAEFARADEIEGR